MYMTFESGLPAHEWCADVKSQCDEREFSRTCQVGEVGQM